MPSYTVVSCEEVKAARSARWEVDTSKGSIRRSYSRQFLVTTDSPKVGAYAVILALGIAIGQRYELGAPGDPWHESDSLSWCNGISVQQSAECGQSWTATVEYGWFEIDENPLDADEEVEWDLNAYERTVDQDTAGDAILNTAGDPFDPPVMRDDSRPVLTIVKNEADFDPSLTYEYRDTVNLYTFFGAPPRTVKLKSRKGRKIKDSRVSGGSYWQVTYVFEFDAATFDKVILNAGLRQLVSGEQKQIFVDGVPASAPQLLDSAGVLTTSPYWLTKEVYQAKDYGVFNITSG